MLNIAIKENNVIEKDTSENINMNRKNGIIIAPINPE